MFNIINFTIHNISSGVSKKTKLYGYNGGRAPDFYPNNYTTPPPQNKIITLPL